MYVSPFTAFQKASKLMVFHGRHPFVGPPKVLVRKEPWIVGDRFPHNSHLLVKFFCQRTISQKHQLKQRLENNIFRSIQRLLLGIYSFWRGETSRKQSVDQYHSSSIFIDPVAAELAKCTYDNCNLPLFHLYHLSRHGVNPFIPSTETLIPEISEQFQTSPRTVASAQSESALPRAGRWCKPSSAIPRCFKMSKAAPETQYIYHQHRCLLRRHLEFSVSED